MQWHNTHNRVPSSVMHCRIKCWLGLGKVPEGHPSTATHQQCINTLCAVMLSTIQHLLQKNQTTSHSNKACTHRQAGFTSHHTQPATTTSYLPQRQIQLVAACYILMSRRCSSSQEQGPLVTQLLICVVSHATAEQCCGLTVISMPFQHFNGGYAF